MPSRGARAYQERSKVVGWSVFDIVGDADAIKEDIAEGSKRCNLINCKEPPVVIS